MFTDAQLAAALPKLNPANDAENGKLTSANVKLLRTALRRAPEILEHPGAYSDLEARLTAAVGIDAQQLQAGLDLLKGPSANAGEVSKQGGRSATYFTKSTNRNDILSTLIVVLYPPRLTGTTGQYNTTAQMVNPVRERLKERRYNLDEELIR